MGLLVAITKRVLETGFEVEMEEHLGYENHVVAGCDGDNSRNGTRAKTVVTEIDPIVLDVPCDRDGSFEPQMVRKRQRRLEGVDAIHIKVRDGQVSNRACYCAIGVTVDVKRDILGIWPGAGGEGAKFWLAVLTEIRNSGVVDACIVCCDRLKGLPMRSTRRGPTRSCRPVSCT